VGDILINANVNKIQHYFDQVKIKSITLCLAAEFIGLGYRQTKRLWKKYKKLGINGLISKKKGKPSNRKIPEKRRNDIAAIIAKNYSDFKPGFASEMLKERHNINLSSETVRQIMIEHLIWFPRKGKKAVHQRRERRLCRGELLQTDASDHAWFENRGPKCHLYIIIDDATSEITDGYFELEETTEGYFKLFASYFKRNGIPLSIYSDKRGVFKVNQGEKNALTQFGRAMKDLGIELICAHSAPAKGRVERAFETLQDRFIREMRLHNISTIEEGNAFIQTYLAKHNLKYGVEPISPHNAHRPLNNNKPLKYILCFKNKRITSKNLEVNYKNKIYQIQEDKTTHHLRKTVIDVIETLDGEILFEHHGKKLKFKEYNSTPFEISRQKMIEDLDLKKTNKVAPKCHQKRDETFSKIVELRGYFEREELLTDEEKAKINLRLEERKKRAREENKELLNDSIDEREAL
jgi:hypothetical protein